MNQSLPEMNLTTYSSSLRAPKNEKSSIGLRQLVTMRVAEKGKPLFCIHPSGGDIGIYRKLVSRIGPNLSVMGIQSRLVCGATNEFPNLQEMAFAYTCLVNEQQPTGVIRLLGFSLGGFVASLMTRELQRFGRSVSFLGLIDSNPNWTTGTGISHRELCLRLTQVFTKFQSIGVMRQKPLATVQKDVSILVNACLADQPITSAEVMAMTTEMGYVPSRQKDAELLMKFTNTFLTHCRLLKNFQPPEINCPLYLWWPSEAAEENESGSKLWVEKANERVTESVIDGSHYSIMRGSAVRVLTAEVEAAIAHEDALCNSDQAT